MAKRLAGVTVLEGGSVKWATVAGIFIGVPSYALTHGLARTIEMLVAAFEWLVLGPFDFVAGLIDSITDGAALGIETGNSSFIVAAQDAGVAAPLFAAVGTFVIAYVAYRGVTAVNG